MPLLIRFFDADWRFTLRPQISLCLKIIFSEPFLYNFTREFKIHCNVISRVYRQNPIKDLCICIFFFPIEYNINTTIIIVFVSRESID